MRDDLKRQISVNAEEIHYAQAFTQLIYTAAKEQGQQHFGKRPLFIRIPPGVHKQIEKAAAKYRKLRQRCGSASCRAKAWNKSFKDVDLGKIDVEIDEYEDAKEQEILKALEAQEEAKIMDQSILSSVPNQVEVDFPDDPIGAELDQPEE